MISAREALALGFVPGATRAILLSFLVAEQSGSST
jgi:hypothetical protein